MRNYLISYDLANPNAKKHVVAEIIMDLGPKWARPLDQTWYVTTEQSEAEIEQRLAWLLGEEDGLLIQAASDKVALTNTKLRWFRRRTEAEGTQASPHVIPLKTREKTTPIPPRALNDQQSFAQAS